MKGVYRMPHIHNVIDTNIHFRINPLTRDIVSNSESITLVQGDHNSERFSFKIPRYIDNHDMSLCNKLYINYDNISIDTKNISHGLYESDDLQILNNDIVCFSWLISRTATTYPGKLKFAITLECLTEDTIDYSWTTNEFIDITVLPSLNNSGLLLTEYIDILEHWKNTVKSGWWINKSAIIFGSSLTASSSIINGYANNIQKICSFSSIRSYSDYNITIKDIYKKIVATIITEDLVIVECGYNDYLKHIPLGTIYSDDINTFAGTLKAIIRNILSKANKSRIVLICDPICMQHGNTGVSMYGGSLSSYIDMIIRIGNMYGITVVDLYRNSGINEHTSNLYYNYNDVTDGALNESGHLLISQTCANVINSMHGAVLPIDDLTLDSSIVISNRNARLDTLRNKQYIVIINDSDNSIAYVSDYPFYMHSPTFDGTTYNLAFVPSLTKTYTFTGDIFEYPDEIDKTTVTAIAGNNDYYYLNNNIAIDNIRSNHDLFDFIDTAMIINKTFN